MGCHSNVLLVACASLVSTIYAYPSGAPTSQCQSMLPGHGVAPQSTRAPYRLVFNHTTYSPSQQLQVAVGGSSYAGLLLQVRSRSRGVPVGSFQQVPTGYRLLTCGNTADSVTHASNNPKDNLLLIWKAPDGNYGDLEIVATVVQSTRIFWTPIRSPAVTFAEDTSRDPCLPSPCRNNGACLSFGRDFRCNCTVNFTGRYCEIPTNIPRDPCSPSPCRNNGACLSYGRDFRCNCTVNFRGRYCEIPADTSRDPCSPSPCRNNGVCVSSGRDFRCNCSVYFMGRYCEMPANTSRDPCSPSPCRNNGVCVSSGRDFRCNCSLNFIGRYCEMPANTTRDPCSSFPCLNGGRCYGSGGYHRCGCLPGFHGMNCEISDGNTTDTSCDFEPGRGCFFTSFQGTVITAKSLHNSNMSGPVFDHTLGHKRGSFGIFRANMGATLRTREVGMRGSVCVSFWYTPCPHHQIHVYRLSPSRRRDGILQVADADMRGVTWRRASTTFTASDAWFALQLELTHNGGASHCLVAIDDFNITQGACVDEPELAVRLSGGPSDEEGRVEVRWRGKWGAICADSFGPSEAATVCRHLGFSLGRTKMLPSYGQGPNQMWLDGLKCPEFGAGSLSECQHHGFGMVGCRPEEYASVRCNVPEVSRQAARKLRLANIRVISDRVVEGRVEVKVDGKWGGVCSLDQQGSQAVCSNFGYEGQATVLGTGARGRAIGPSLIDSVTCDRGEKDFWNCKKQPAPSSGCSNPDVAVRCTYNVKNFPYSCSMASNGSCNLLFAPYSDSRWTIDRNDPTVMACYSRSAEAGVCSMVTETVDTPPDTGHKCLRYSYIISDRNAGDLKVYIHSRGRKPQVVRWTARDPAYGHGVSGNYDEQVDLDVDTFKVIFMATVAPSYSGYVGVRSFDVTTGLCSSSMPPPRPTLPPRRTDQPTRQPPTRPTTRTVVPTRQPPSPSLPTRHTDPPVPRPTATESSVDSTVGKVVYSCDFDADSCASTTDYSGPSMPGQRSFLWTRRRGSTPSGGTGPDSDNGGSGYYIFIESSSPASPGMTAVLATKQALPAGTYCLRFAYHMNGNGMGSVNVKWADGTVWSKSGNQGTDWKREELTISASSSSSLTIEGVRGNSWQGDAALDDIQLSTGACTVKRDPCSSNPCRSSGAVCQPKGDTTFSCVSASTDRVRCSFDNWSAPCEEGSVVNGTRAEDGNEQLWNYHRGSTPSSGTGPSGDHSGNGGYMYLEVSNIQKGKFARLKTPLLRGNTFCVSFWTFIWGQHVDRLEVNINGGTGGYTTVQTIRRQGQKGVDSWNQQRVTVSLPSASSVRIALDAYVGNAYQGDIAIDDLDVIGGIC